MSIKKILVNFLCCFVPGKTNRKEIKRKLFGTKNRLRKLLAAGCQIEDKIVTTSQGVRIDISHVPHEALGITMEVFLKKDYAINFSCDAVVIDIGLNRSIAALFFATYPNVKKVYAFEPFKPTFELAKRNLELNPHLSKKINAFNFGLGKAETTLELPYMDTVTGGMSTTHDVCKGEKNIRKEKVLIKDAAKELTRILEENKNKYILVKCDCEGAEFEIFERLKEQGLIGKMDMVLMEYHYNKPDGLVGIFTSHGFVVRTRVLSEATNKGYIYAVRMAGK